MIIRHILTAALAVSLTLGCGGKEAPDQAAAQEAVDKALAEADKALDEAVKAGDRGAEAAKEAADEAMKKADEAAKAAEEKVEEAAKEAKEVAEEAKEAVEAKADDATPAPPGFKEYKNASGNFRIEAPGTAKEDKTTADSVLGKVTYNNIMFTLSDGALMAAWGDMPVEPEDAAMKKSMFDGGRDGMLKSINGKLIEEKVIELSGMEGREWLIEIDAGPQIGKITNHVRTYLQGKRNYILQGMHVAGAPATKAVYFLDSFKLLD